MTEALDATDITKVGIGLIIAIVVIGLLLSLVISALIGRIIIAVIVIALGSFIWQQRSSVEDKINSYQDKINSYQKEACNFNATFFGVHVSAPDHITQACRQHRRQHSA